MCTKKINKLALKKLNFKGTPQPQRDFYENMSI